MPPTPTLSRKGGGNNNRELAEIAFPVYNERRRTEDG